MRSPPRWIPAAAVLIWAAWILWLGTDDRRRVIGFSGTSSEGLQHIVAFAVLGALAMLTARRRPWMVFGLVALGGVVGEFAQLATSDRTFSVVDMAFSGVGAGIGVAVVRRTGWHSTTAVMLVAGLLIAIAPIALELSDIGPETSFPDACSAPLPPAVGAPEKVLDVEFAAGSGDAFPIGIEEPTTAVLRERLVATGEFSVAVEFSTDSLDQEGPVRLFTISNGTGSDEVNFHLGLDHEDLSVRLRTSCDIFNWIVVPDVVTAGEPHGVVVTWAAGTLDVWVDALRVKSVSLPSGDLEPWDPTYLIIVGDEAGGGRRFQGLVSSVTMWNRALDQPTAVDASASHTWSASSG